MTLSSAGSLTVMLLTDQMPARSPLAAARLHSNGLKLFFGPQTLPHKLRCGLHLRDGGISDVCAQYGHRRNHAGLTIECVLLR